MPSNLSNNVSNIVIENSITFDNVKTAVDYYEPLPFLTWLNYANLGENDSNYIFNNYRFYLRKWYAAKEYNVEEQNDFVRSSFVNLLKEIILSYTTLEERRFVTNINYTNNEELYSVLPFYVSKFKEVCKYYSLLRETVRGAKYKNNFKGSVQGITQTATNEILNAIQAGDISVLFKSFNLNIDNIKNNIQVNIKEFIDDTQYYDINPGIPLSSYDDSISSERQEFRVFNENRLNTELFLDFDASIVDAIQSYPYFLEGLDASFHVNIQATSNDLQLLKDRDFISLINNQSRDNLALNLQKELIEKFIGTDYYYISTGDFDTNTNNLPYLSSVLFKAKEPYANILNKRFPSTATVPDEASLTNIRNIGGFFMPDKLGVMNFNAFKYSIQIDTQKLEPNKVYVFPDPYKFGNIRGESRTDFETPPLVYTEDLTWYKFNRTFQYIYGNIKSNPLLKNFYGYYSRSQIIGYQPVGTSRSIDSTEFFEGLTKDVWANTDVFPITGNEYPLDQRQETLLVINKTLVKFKTDIFGNGYGLYKDVYPTGVTPDGGESDEFLSKNDIDYFNFTGGRSGTDGSGRRGVTSNRFNYKLQDIKRCKVLDGYKFKDKVDGYNFDFSKPNPGKNISGVISKVITQIPPGSGYYTPTLSAYYIVEPFQTYPTFLPLDRPLLLAGYGEGHFFPDKFCNINNIVYCLVLDCRTFVDLNSAFFIDFPSDSPNYNQFTPTYYSVLVEGGLDINGKIPNNVSRASFTFSYPASSNITLDYNAYIFNVKGLQPCVVKLDESFTPDVNYSLDVVDIVNAPLDPSNLTQVPGLTSSLYRRESLHNSRYIVPGSLYVKNANTTVAAPIKYTLKSLFKKYPEAVTNELDSVIDFDVIYNTIFIETENYYMMDKLNYDYATNEITPYNSDINYLQKYENFPEIERISVGFFNEKQKSYVFAKIKVLPELSSYNTRVIYPEIYYVDLANPNFKKLFPIFTETYENLSGFQFNRQNINFERLDKPIITFNEDSNTYLLNYFAKNPNNVFVQAFMEFKINNAKISTVKTGCYVPEIYIEDFNFAETYDIQ